MSSAEFAHSMVNDYITFTVLFSISVLCQGTTTSEETTKCEPPWTAVFDGCYMFEKDNFLPWDAAQTECRLYGGDLLSISNKKELVSHIR